MEEMTAERQGAKEEGVEKGKRKEITAENCQEGSKEKKKSGKGQERKKKKQEIQ